MFRPMDKIMNNLSCFKTNNFDDIFGTKRNFRELDLLDNFEPSFDVFILGARVEFFCFSVFWLCPYGSLWFLSVEERIERWTNNLKLLLQGQNLVVKQPWQN